MQTIQVRQNPNSRYLEVQSDQARMGCCCSIPPDHGGASLVKRRSCTDILFLILFIASYGAIIALAYGAGKNGQDPRSIIYGVDVQGRICGVSPGVENNTLAAWPYPLSYGPKICVHSCSETSDGSNNQMTWLYTTAKFAYYCLPNVDLVSLSNLANGGSSSANVTNDFSTEWDSASNQLTRMIGDVYISWPILLAAVPISIVASYLFVFLLRYIAGLLIWLCVVFLVIAGVVIGVLLYQLSQDLANNNNYSTNQVNTSRYAAYGMWILTGLFVIVILALRKEIKIAIEVVKEAARALSDMKLLVLFPIIPILCVVIYSVGWIVCALYIFSVSTREIQPLTSHSYFFWPNPLMNGQTNTALGSTISVRTYTSEYRYYAIGLLFHFFWNLEFIFYMTYLIIAGAVASWYFARRDPSGNKIRGSGDDQVPNSPIWESVYRSFRFHIGTVALCAFIIATIQTIRAIIKYIEAKCAATGEPNLLQKAVLRIIGCCLYCLQCCCDKINQNALIWTAIWGDSFIPAACNSFALLWRNLFKVAAINTVTTILLWIGRFTVALLTMAVGAYAIGHASPYQSQITSPLVPMMIIFIIAYVIGSLFMAIFDTIIDTTFLCFLVDEEKNGKQNDMRAHKDLCALVNKFSKESSQTASNMASARFENPNAAPQQFNQNASPVPGQGFEGH